MNLTQFRMILRRVLITLFFIMTLLAVIVPTWHIYMGEGREMFMINHVSPANQGQSLILNASVLDVNFNEKSYLIHFVFQPSGSLANPQGQLQHDMTISFSHSQKYTYLEGERLMPFQVRFDYDDGNPIDYPFDRYTGYFEMEATISNTSSSGDEINVNTTSKDHRQIQHIPLSFRLEASLTSFSFVPTLTPMDQRLGLKIMTGRSTTTLGFSLFMCLLMWALSLVMAIFGYQVLFHRRPVHGHAVMVGITMLFALPALRSAQPGIPDVGCISDVLGFYWNMAIIALESVTILACWIARWDANENSHRHRPFSINHESPSFRTFQKMEHIEHIEHLTSSASSRSST